MFFFFGKNNNVWVIGIYLKPGFYKAKYNIYETLSTVFSVAGFRLFEKK